MNTMEHTELGDALRFHHWDTLKNNPYIHIDEQDRLHLNLQAVGNEGLPEQIDLNLSVGAIIAMSGDYFGGKEVLLDLPSIADFKSRTKASFIACDALSNYLIKESVSTAEQQKLLNSYKRLANERVRQSDIETIYTINNSKYIPFSNALNFLAQQVMLALRVKNYSEILNRNFSHFTPWSVRVYCIGHFIALKYARIHYELKQLLMNADYQSDNQEFNTLYEILKQTPDGLSADKVQDIAHRYQALALGMEFFCFHYYTDHYAAGHLSFVGDLRIQLPKNFGVWGSILVNNLHDELNRVSVYTKRIYTPTPAPDATPVKAFGDDDFDNVTNYCNKQACLTGMSDSLQDLNEVFNGGIVPEQSQYGGLKQLPDIDYQNSQPQPLILMGDDNQIYYRSNLKQINTLSLSQLQATYNSPSEYGYTKLKNKIEAFALVFKLRVLSFIYTGKLNTTTAEQIMMMRPAENEFNAGRKPSSQPELVHEPKEVMIPKWRKSVNDNSLRQGLVTNSLLSTPKSQGDQVHPGIKDESKTDLSLVL